MSSALRNIQKQNKSRSGRGTRHQRKGPASQQQQAPRRVDHAPVGDDGKPLPPDLSKADPGCNKCYGTGRYASQAKGAKLACSCVVRGMHGDAPWQRRVRRLSPGR